MLAAASAATVSTSAVSATSVSAATAIAAMNRRCTSVAAVNDRCTPIAAMNDRCTSIATMDHRCATIAAMNHRSAAMTATTNCSTRMSAAPTVPAVAAAPTQTTTERVAAPIPARPPPSVVVPAILATEPNELGAFDDIQAVGRSTKRFRRDDWRRASAHNRYAANENCCRPESNREFTHDVPVSLKSEGKRRAGLFVP